MNINTLKITNFLAIGAGCPTLNLANRGLVLIEGTNGVGKSTIADALSWCYFNVTARGESGDAVINNIAKKNCEVVGEIDDDGQLYRISRYRKHKTHKNMVRVEKRNGEDWADITRASDKDTQELIEEILGCSRDVFVSAIYAGQEALPDLPRMTDKSLKAIIEEAAGIDKFEQAYQLARSELLDIKNDRQILDDGLEAQQDRLRSDERSLENINEQMEEFEKGREGRHKAELEKAADIKKAIAVMGAQYKALDTDKLNSDLKACSEKMDSAKPAQKAYDDAQKALHTAEIKASNSAASLQRSANQAKRMQEQVKNAPEEMKKPCSECGKPHTEEEHDEYVKHWSSRFKAEVEVVRQKRDAHALIQKEVDSLGEAVKTAQGSIPDLTAVSAEYSRINAKLREAGDMKATLGRKLAEYQNAIKQAENCKTEPNPAKSAQTLLIERIKESQAKIDKFQKVREQADVKQQIAEDVVRVFSPAGVRAHILDTVTPFLNERTDDYLSILSDGQISAVWSTLGETAKGELREKFNIAVTNAKGGKTFGLLSGGEKKRVRLATMMALQDLQASRASKPIQLFVADEVDTALDVGGLERLMVILERRARDRGTVLLISHQDLRDWATQVTTIEKTPSGSIAEGVLVES